MTTFGPLDGALLVDKPAGPTSHDLVAGIRRRFKIKKVGHCGTLDPNATGLMILVLGKATKLSERLMGEDKVYSGTMKLGESTNSYDADGELTASLPVPDISLEDLNEAAEAFRGDQMQKPPMVSAIKQGGVPLYKLARKGVEVDRPERFIHVYRFRFHRVELPYADFEVACTKGTYVRALAHDLGDRLGCGAHLSALRRLQIGPFQVDQATPFKQLSEFTLDQLQQAVIPIYRLAQNG